MKNQEDQIIEAAVKYERSLSTRVEFPVSHRFQKHSMSEDLKDPFMMTGSVLVIALIATMCFAFSARAEYVNGYVNSNGTYVQGYYRSTADSTPTNNYSTHGNTNPYTGQQGTRQPDYTPKTYENPYAPKKPYGY